MLLAIKVERTLQKDTILGEVPEHGVLRPRRVRDRGGRADLLRRAGATSDDPPIGHARGHPHRARGLRPDRPSVRRQVPAGLRARPDGAVRLPRRRARRTVEAPGLLRDPRSTSSGDRTRRSRHRATPSTSSSTCGRRSPRRYGPAAVFGGGLAGDDLARPRAIRPPPKPRSSPTSRAPGDPGAALVAIEPATGHILAMAGGKDFATSQLNLATFKGGTGRQAGSAFKAFTLAEAMDQGFRLDSRWYGPNTITIDDPVCADQDGEPWEPENAEGGGSSYTLQSATAHSVNTVFAQLVVELGPDNVVDMAHRARDPIGPAGGVCGHARQRRRESPRDDERVRDPVARGIRFRASPLLQVRSPGGRIDEGVVPQGKRVVDENVADLVTYTLQDVLDFGTGASADIGLAGRGEDGHGAGQRGRLVLRLHRPDRGVRVGGLPAGADPARERRRGAAGLRRHDPGRDLARLHGRWRWRARRRSSSRTRPSTSRP